MTQTSSEVDLHEVMEWAQEQSQFLRSPASRLVLWYLTINAFRYDKNPEHAPVGTVMSGRTSYVKIRRGTGYSERAVRDALRDLQGHGYILAEMQPGWGASNIQVFWSATADDMRDEARRGLKPLPKVFLEAVKPAPRKTSDDAQDAVVLAMPYRQNLPQ